LKNKEKRNSISKSKGKTEDESKASVATESGSEGDVLVAFAGCAKIDDEWILDSACTFHICIHKEWFTTYDSVQGGGSVLMGDSTPRKIVGIGSIQIKMSDGVIRTLTNVRHIPTMTRNLISLSTLDLKGYRYSAGGGVMNVSIGSLVVMKGDLKSANLWPRSAGCWLVAEADSL
jgi:5'-3' exoribonuclease 2